SEDEPVRLTGAEYNYPHTMYQRAKLFPEGSAKRKELCSAVLDLFGEFELNWGETTFNLYANIESGLCYKELGKTDDALSSIDRTISIRDTWDKNNKKPPRWELPKDVQDLGC